MVRMQTEPLASRGLVYVGAAEQLLFEFAVDGDSQTHFATCISEMLMDPLRSDRDPALLVQAATRSHRHHDQEVGPAAPVPRPGDCEESRGTAGTESARQVHERCG